MFLQDTVSIKQQYNVPPALYSCHTAIVDGYIIEGHVPAAEIHRLLKGRPRVIGLAVAGMPAGAPGMDAPGAVPEPYDVLTFDQEGKTAVFARYTP